jgi:hypothetical protein
MFIEPTAIRLWLKLVAAFLVVVATLMEFRR